MKRHPSKQVYFALLLLLSATSCIREYFGKTPHPDEGAVVITTAEWTKQNEDIPVPSSYTVELQGKTTILTNTPSALSGVYTPGEAGLTAWNMPQGISIDKGIATVGNDGATGLLLSTPGILFTGKTDITIIQDDTVHITLPMQQQMRQVRFTLTVTGNPERIITAEGRLNGIATSINLKTGEITGNAAIALTFTRKGDKLTAEAWTVGVVAEAKQQLQTTLTFSNGDRIETTADVADAFRDFNTNKPTPLDITGSLYVPAIAEPDGTIIDWTQGNGDGDNVNTIS